MKRASSFGHAVPTARLDGLAWLCRRLGGRVSPSCLPCAHRRPSRRPAALVSSWLQSGGCKRLDLGHGGLAGLQCLEAIREILSVVCLAIVDSMELG